MGDEKSLSPLAIWRGGAPTLQGHAVGSNGPGKSSLESLPLETLQEISLHLVTRDPYATACNLNSSDYTSKSIQAYFSHGALKDFKDRLNLAVETANEISRRLEARDVFLWHEGERVGRHGPILGFLSLEKRADLVRRVSDPKHPRFLKRPEDRAIAIGGLGIGAGFLSPDDQASLLNLTCDESYPHALTRQSEEINADVGLSKPYEVNQRALAAAGLCEGLPDFSPRAGNYLRSFVGGRLLSEHGAYSAENMGIVYEGLKRSYHRQDEDSRRLTERIGTYLGAGPVERMLKEPPVYPSLNDLKGIRSEVQKIPANQDFLKGVDRESRRLRDWWDVEHQLQSYTKSAEAYAREEMIRARRDERQRGGRGR